MRTVAPGSPTPCSLVTLPEIVAPLCALKLVTAQRSNATAPMLLRTNFLIIAFVELGGWKPEPGRARPDINVSCIALPFMFVRQSRARVWALTLRRSELNDHPKPDAARSPFLHDGCVRAAR